jgi:chorismate lyase/3-hydroxybenzoate synthase
MQGSAATSTQRDSSKSAGQHQPVNTSASQFEHGRPATGIGSPIDIAIRTRLEPPTPEHSLLAGFHFGAPGAADLSGAVVNPGLLPINEPDCYEGWWYRGDVRYSECGDVRIAECDDYACLILQRPDRPPGQFRLHARTAYQDLLKVAEQARHGHIARLWNYFPQINEGANDAEKYRQFSIGRAEAFETAGIADASAPAGTAIGCPQGGEFSVVALLSKHYPRPAENPRQVSAYDYPTKYGPRSPKFSRGVRIAGEHHQLFLISGTASVVGHESVHANDTSLQTEETLRNLGHLSRAMTDTATGMPLLALDSTRILRVYLRNRRDLDNVAGQLRRELGDLSSSAVFLHGDICRRELTIEIDGVGIA